MPALTVSASEHAVGSGRAPSPAQTSFQTSPSVVADAAPLGRAADTQRRLEEAVRRHASRCQYDACCAGVSRRKHTEYLGATFVLRGREYSRTRQHTDPLWLHAGSHPVPLYRPRPVAGRAREAAGKGVPVVPVATSEEAEEAEAEAEEQAAAAHFNLRCEDAAATRVKSCGGRKKQAAARTVNLLPPRLPAPSD